MILTEQSIYFFNKNEDISASEAVVMKLADTEAVYKGTKPSYRKYSFRFHPHRKLPICLDPFIYFVELRVKQKGKNCLNSSITDIDSNSIHKRRILALNSKTIAKDWVKLIKLQNLSSIYASSTCKFLLYLLNRSFFINFDFISFKEFFNHLFNHCVNYSNSCIGTFI